MATEAVVIGAGMIGAACAYYLDRAGVRVTVLEAGSVGSGTTGAGQGAILVSSHAPDGPVLPLALWSRRLWTDLGEEVGPDAIELTRTGGLVVAARGPDLDRLAVRVTAQRAAGVAVTELAAAELPAQEPKLVEGLAGGARYPQDALVQPVRAAAQLLRGLDLRCGQRVTAVETNAAGQVTGVRVGSALVRAGVVVNATGVASAGLAATVGTTLPVAPRRGFVLVTEPLANARDRPPVRHIVQAAEYAELAAGTGPRSAPVVAATLAGPVLIGSTREEVGTDPSYPLALLSRLATQAVGLFPFLAGVRVLRAYRGFRPYTPDGVPVIGPDPRVGGLWHAGGHEGAGIGLAPATGALIAAQVTGAAPEADPAPFSATRFA